MVGHRVHVFPLTSPRESRPDDGALGPLAILADARPEVHETLVLHAPLRALSDQLVVGGDIILTVQGTAVKELTDREKIREILNRVPLRAENSR